MKLLVLFVSLLFSPFVHASCIQLDDIGVEESISEFTGCHTYYAVKYDIDTHNPILAVYKVNKNSSLNKTRRYSHFIQDIQVPDASDKTYRKTGYDKGHLAPARIFRFNKAIEKESFYRSNITPQLAGVNRGIWKKLEGRVRKFAKVHDVELLVIAGPIYRDLSTPMYLQGSSNNPRIPEAFYKIIYDITNDKVISFVFDNVKPPRRYKLSPYVFDIDTIETDTSIGFFGGTTSIYHPNETISNKIYFNELLK